MVDANTKLKSLALILRSLSPEVQRTIYSQLPEELVRRITHVSLSLDSQLTSEDWETFSKFWPEFGHLINNVKEESKFEQCNLIKISERSKIKDYIDYRINNKKDRPNLTGTLTKIIDNYISNNAY